MKTQTQNLTQWTTAAVLLITAQFIADAATRYVWQGSPSPGPPYTTWATAATNIQVAVDAAMDGDTVLVTNGVYASGGKAIHGTMTNRVAVDKPLTLRSINGPEVTIIEGAQAPGGGNGDGAIRCVYLTNDAVVSGFTLTNGATREDGSTPAYYMESSGGGIWCESVSAVATNCVLTGNSAKFNGGGAYSGTLNQCMLKGNSALLAWGQGGGASYSTLNACTLTGNTAGEGGGTHDSTLNSCTLTGNSASRSGGGANGGTLNNCVITGNEALGGIASGFGLQVQGGGGAYYATLNNCTLTGNSAGEGGGGGAYGGTLNNCIVYFNTAIMGGNHASDDWSRITLNYCCTTPLPSVGEGNLDLEPQLASASHLSEESPCIGAGSSAYSTGTDIDGQAWADPPSIGCDEYLAGSVTGPLSVGIEATFTNMAVGFNVVFQALIEGRVSASVWDFGDGTVVSNLPYTSHAWAATGHYPVTLTACNETYPSGVSATVTVHVVAQPVHYVSLESTAPLAPYSTWATAAANINDAVAAATLPGALVLVSNGVYAIGGRAVDGASNRVVVDKPLSLMSVNGPEATVILGSTEPRIRCVYLTSDAVLSGFTLTNGAADLSGVTHRWSGGGVYCASLSAVVSNCTLTGNSAELGGGAYSGTLNNCRLTENWAWHGGAAYGGTLNSCTLSSNEGTLGGGAWGATLNDCILAGNLVSGSGLPFDHGSGGGAFFSTLDNCVLIGNEAQDYADSGGASECTLNNCTLTGNSGGGASGCTLNNCTLTGNSDGGAYGGTLNNCIVYYNTAEWGDDNFWGGTLNYTCTYPLPANGVGNITNAPVFVDTNGWADLRLQPNSPCIDSGNNDFVTWDIDLDGNPRILNGIVDMGAYEFVPLTPAEMVEHLITLVNDSNLRHKRPLLASLEAALASIERGNHNSATAQLGAFQSKVGAQVAKKDAELAMELIEAADQVVAALNEGPSGQLAGRIHSLKRHPNGKMQMKIKGEAGKAYILEASTNLVDWEAVGTATIQADGSFELEDPDAAKHQSRFYRVVDQ